MSNTYGAKWVSAIGFAVLAAGCTPVKRPDGGVGPLPIGARAPDLVARAPDKSEVRLSDLRGRRVVVYFYPADGTPGCTAEACAFRDVWRRYEDANIAVIGVSSNTAEEHATFQQKENLPFALAADHTGQIGAAFGVAKTPFGGYDRVSFLLDRDGRVLRLWPSVDPGVHAEEVLREAKRIGD